MAFTRESVRISGILRGRGETAKCMVSALRVTLEGTPLFKDCQFSVDWVSKALPDGEYTLSFENKTINMHYSKNSWRTIAV